MFNARMCVPEILLFDDNLMADATQCVLYIDSKLLVWRLAHSDKWAGGG